MNRSTASSTIESKPSERNRSEAVRLMREIRFSIDRDWARAAHGKDGFAGAHPISNSWGGWPSAVGVAPYLVMRIVVSGQPDAETGYLVNIQELDKLLRQRAIPLAARRLLASGVGLTGESLLIGIWKTVSREVPAMCRAEALRLWTTPYLSYGIRTRGEAMIELTQCFEFSAAHRLHVASMSAEENRRCFGKCNNPNGHGHNYQVEVTIARAVGESPESVLPLPEFESVVKREVIDRLDHKHLNADVPEFAKLNPSVENIARTIWGFLDGKLPPATLRKVRVWETAKTYAEYASG
ncbi:MAG: 6-pyruvoyl tetrahydropterin synthase family protein [Phycisphaerae bacterium]